MGHKSNVCGRVYGPRESCMSEGGWATRVPQCNLNTQHVCVMVLKLIKNYLYILYLEDIKYYFLHLLEYVRIYIQLLNM